MRISKRIHYTGGFLTSVFLCFFLICVYPILCVLICNSHLMKMRLSASVHKRSKFWELESGQLKSLSLLHEKSTKWKNLCQQFFAKLNFLIWRGRGCLSLSFFLFGWLWFGFFCLVDSCSIKSNRTISRKTFVLVCNPSWLWHHRILNTHSFQSNLSILSRYC